MTGRPRSSGRGGPAAASAAPSSPSSRAASTAVPLKAGLSSRDCAAACSGLCNCWVCSRREGRHDARVQAGKHRRCSWPDQWRRACNHCSPLSAACCARCAASSAAHRQEVCEVAGRVHLAHPAPKVWSHPQQVAQAVPRAAPHPPARQAHARLVAQAGRVCRGRKTPGRSSGRGW